jgi:hypothetical protein
VRSLFSIAKVLLAAELFLASVAQASSPAISLSFDELVEHPTKYNGRQVSVRAYAVTSCTECNVFYASRQAARAASARGTISKHGISIGRVARGYALPKWFAMRLFKVPPHTEGYDGYVHIVGTFRYIDLTPAPTLKPKKITEVQRRDGVVEREIVTMKNGFGWWGLYDKTITNMTECLPLGPPVPSGL